MNERPPTEIILGYDCREFWLPDWNRQRRQGFLFRLDVLKPFSIDHNVWPSIFDVTANEMPSGQASVKLPHLKGPNRLWNDLDELINFVNASWGSQWPQARLVCYSLILFPTDEIRPYWYDALSGISLPDDVDVSWDFLGYDVADDSRISGLSNCGFTEDENVDELRQKWSSELNENHLFDALHSAASFREMTNERVKEHAPFFIYGIYSLKAIKGIETGT